MRTADDVIKVQEIIHKLKSRVPVIAKIEKPEAVENIEGIIEATDAIMIARGDMFVSIPIQEVPLIQKMIIKKVMISKNDHQKTIIWAEAVRQK